MRRPGVRPSHRPPPLPKPAVDEPSASLSEAARDVRSLARGNLWKHRRPEHAHGDDLRAQQRIDVPGILAQVREALGLGVEASADPPSRVTAA